MSSDTARQVYEDLGVRPLINAGGNKTILGGSRVSPAVQAAADLANRYYVDMEELLKRTGEMIADWLGAEAAMVTSGCYAAIALGAAACMSGSDHEKIEQLPDTTGMKHEFIVQACQHYKYNRALSIFGGKLIQVGDEQGATASQLKAAITNQTAAIHYLAIGQWPGAIPFETVVEIAKEYHIPLIVDAASAVYPLEELRRYNEMGADLVCYGAKYFGAYNGTGILAGRKDLLDAAFLHSFIGFEKRTSRSLGRGFKLDRQEIIGVVAALREWLSMDHEERIAEHERKGQVIRQAVAGIPRVSAEWRPDPRTLSSSVRVTIDESRPGQTAAQVSQALREGNPSIWVTQQNNELYVSVPQLVEGEEQIVAERLRAVLLES
jgi:L-seryl-tRNA(Ser) seleniumtransferase